ncbi:MAG: L,D-transpeptidase family protein [Campylobacterota bacterium]|nr:L,D-transpeptidase family protein [Campylobacterota bacterium]
MTVLNKFHFLILIVSSSLFANNILTDYRTNGIYSVQKYMDEQLTKEEYWNKHLKKINTRFGYIESYSNILTCDKSKSTLRLYIKENNESYRLQKEYSAYTGKIEGDKVKEGDLKTPVGIYDLTKKISKLDSFYGPLAFVTSYPNTYDKYRGKNGSGIWIHGLPTEQERDEYTRGCIAIDNQSIECLDKNINIDDTLLIIRSQKEQQDIDKKILASLLASLYSWRYSWIYNDIDSYLNYYSTDFMRYDGMNYERFFKYKTRIFKKSEKKEIIFNNLNIVPYPGSDNIYKVSFNEKYESDSFKFTGKKVLIINFNNNNFKIITEK